MDDLELLKRIRTLIVVAMFSDDELMRRLVLKGGNLMDLVYDISARSSADLDFSIDGDFPNNEDLLTRIKAALMSTFSEAGYVAFDVKLQEVPRQMLDRVKDFWGGYKVHFKLISQKRFDELGGKIEELRKYAEKTGSGDSPTFHIDLSKHEFCAGKEEYELDDFVIYGLSPLMFVCEKLRAICQQMEEYRIFVGKNFAPRARDFLDIYVATDYYLIDLSGREHQDILRQTFAAKRVPLELLGKIESVREEHRENFDTVRATVMEDFPLRDYDFYFDFVLERCSDLESLWNE